MVYQSSCSLSWKEQIKRSEAERRGRVEQEAETFGNKKKKSTISFSFTLILSGLFAPRQKVLFHIFSLKCFTTYFSKAAAEAQRASTSVQRDLFCSCTLTEAAEPLIVAASFTVNTNTGVRADPKPSNTNAGVYQALTLNICSCLCHSIQQRAPYNHQTLHQISQTLGVSKLNFRGGQRSRPAPSPVRRGAFTNTMSRQTSVE